jgi:arginase family enzyme
MHSGKVAATLFGCPPGTGGDILVLGFPFDRGSSDRFGCRKAPRIIRRATHGFEQRHGGIWDHRTDRRLLRNVSISDAGDLRHRARRSLPDYLRDVGDAAFAVRANGRRLLSLGGDHLVTLGLVEGISRGDNELQIVQLDAHEDIRTRSSGSPPTHASFMADVLEIGNVRRVVQVGLRGFGRHRRVRHGKLIRCSIRDVARNLLPGVPLYLTVDTDVFDPAIAPAVSYPLADGITLDDFRRVLRSFRDVGAELIAADWVEYNPAYDRANHQGLMVVIAGLAALLEYWTP